MKDRVFNDAEVALMLTPDRWTVNFASSVDKNNDGTMECHDRIEIVFTVSGSYNYRFNGEHIHLTPGSLVLLTPGVMHEKKYHLDCERGKHLWCYPNGKEVLLRLVEFGEGRRDILLHSCRSLPEEYQLDLLCMQFVQSSGNNYRIRKRLELALMMLFDLVSDSHIPDVHWMNYHSAAMGFARIYIREHLHDGVDINKIARTVGYSRFHFVRLFHHYSGCTVQEWANSCRRLELQQLEKAHVPGKIIAEKLGFKTLSGFYHWRSAQRKTQL